MEEFSPRDLSSATLMGNNFSPDQEFILQLVALIASSISILGGVFALYWFFRIKSFFRHQLVTFLICSDLFKALWYFISAALALKLNPVRFSSDFCQASGFFLSFGIEASDFAILTIAVHSALCIFRPKTNLGETGLFGIRYYVYFLWVALPLLSAGLGLLNGGVYIDTGAFCWLPVRPFYYRLALSWIPRYLIFLTILFLYARIYWFVSAKFKNFHLSTGDSYKRPSELANGSVSRSRKMVSQMFGAKSTSENTGEPRKYSNHVNEQLTAVSDRALENETTDNETSTQDGPSWENYTFGSTRIPLPVPNADEVTPAPIQLMSEHLNKGSVSTQRTKVTDSVIEDGRKSLVEFLKEDPPEGFMTGPNLNAALVTEEVNHETQARRTAIKRQLRFLFIYPVCYIISWIPPLVQHFTLYNSDVAAHPNFALACISTAFVALQCFMDSVIFSYRETPWRHVRNGSTPTEIDESQPGTSTRDGGSGHSGWTSLWRKAGPENPNSGTTESEDSNGEKQLGSHNPSYTNTPRSSFVHRFGTSFRSNSQGNTNNRLSGSSGSFFAKAQGKSRGEMIAEARAAHHRRDLEINTAREGQEERQRARKQSFLRRGGADRSWWEVEGRKRKDSVLLGTDPDVSRTRSRGNTEASVSAGPSFSASNLFGPRRFRGSISNPSNELSPRTAMPMALGEEAESPGLAPERRPSQAKTEDVSPITVPRDIAEIMPIVEEEEDPTSTQE